MAKSRSKTALAKVIEKSDSPVYLIDASQRLAYGNEAFFTWIGSVADETSDSETPLDWIGTRLVYSNSLELTPMERHLSGLAPPPELFNRGQAFTATVSSNSSEAGNQQPQNTNANFSFITGPSDQQYLLAVIPNRDAHDQESATPVGQSESATLHEALRELAASIADWHRCSALIGDSPYVDRLRKQVKAASQHSHEFTILGPQGSGRELLARLIMQQRAGETPTADDESQLVTLHGYVADRELVQSCVTQATDLATKLALEASSRTDQTQPWLLILDADQLDAASQTELWSTLQMPSSRLRVVATAERDLVDCVGTIGFHSGLAHLLTTQTIETIPLEQHLADLPLLVQYEIENCNVNRQDQLSGLSVAAMQMMKQYPWPGDLAELAAIIESASDKCVGNEISENDLPEKFRFAIAALQSPPNEVIEIDLEKYLASIELQLVDRALRMAKGNKTKASKLLGVSRAKLLRRIQHFDLQQPTQPSPDQPTAGLSADDFRPLDEPLFEEADE